MVLGQEHVRALGVFPLGRQRRHLVPAVERVLLALGLFFQVELAAGRNRAILGGALKVVRVRGGPCHAVRLERQSGGAPARFHAGHEALEVFLLFDAEWLVVHP